MSETLDRLANSSYYSTLDMVSGYWQLSLNPRDRCKTSLAIPGVGTYMFKVMCFGIKMRLVLSPDLWKQFCEGCNMRIVWCT